MIAKIILVVLWLLGAGVILSNFGKEKKGTYGWADIISLLISLLLYYFAGMFDFIKF